MNTKALVKVSAMTEMLTGVALMLSPNLVATLLLGVGLSGSGNAVARLTGIALVCLGIAGCPSRNNATRQAIQALFVYNLLAGLYLCYLRVGGGFAGYLLVPASAIHLVIALLLLFRVREKELPA